MPNEGILALHDLRRSYSSFEEFQPDLPSLLQQGSLLPDCIEVTRALGMLEPLTGEHIPPELIEVQGTNYRESLIANGLLSRNRALLLVLEQAYGTLDKLAKQDIYLVEALSGFALWLQHHLGEERLICSEYLEQAEQTFTDILHQDLCALTFSDASFDLVICNELFEHVADLELAFREIARVLRPGGRLLATCPMAFGQWESIEKAQSDPHGGQPLLFSEAELHGDPIRPELGSLVFRIPGWEVLEKLNAAAFGVVTIEHVASWKHGVLGSDLPGVLVINAVAV
ncbi:MULTISPECIES: class I SAM-dependent methyltransferase [unclassified Cyanobium]|uniref:class I SAM-dependent methyltransferase n=1 Tax=unclassified Cyanobium TaxID=2627006 RepID=UPI0020CC4CD7|nr:MULTISPECIES: class I SAM-dependent methyltransferase [unclassified Cyanobium]